MEQTLSLEDFYRQGAKWVPETLKSEIGHFNVFRSEEFRGEKAKPIPYRRKDFYKVSLIIGKTVFHYADKIIDVKRAALMLSNPMVPYSCQAIDEKQEGCFCVFTEAFFNQLPHVKEYPIFKPGTVPVYELTDADIDEIQHIFNQMLREISSDYVYKYDVLRALVLQLIHKAIRLTPSETQLNYSTSADERITTLFVELLERQFPIESPQQRMKVRTPADFATHLSVHINHLNRVLKKITEKTTSQLIANRVVQEARTLLKHTDWNVSEIGYCLGFEESSHFISFFKRNMQVTPKVFRR